MVISIRDRMTVAFHQMINGNIPATTAVRLAQALINLDDVRKADADVIMALQKKVATSHNCSLYQVMAALAHVDAKKSELEQAKQLDQGKNIIKKAEDSLDKYLAKKQQIADKLYSSFSYDLKNEVAEKLLMDHGVEMFDAEHLAITINDLKYNWEIAVSELNNLRKKRDAISKMSGATHEDHLQMVAYDRDYMRQLTTIVPLEERIVHMEERMESAKEAKVETIINVARINAYQISQSCKDLLNECDRLEAQVINVPELLLQTNARLGETRGYMDNAQSYDERLKGLHNELQKATSVEDLENKVAFFNRANEKARIADSAWVPTTAL